eukprot:CAMPEP_0179006326 /NCGR_PEP_ID=MMETSP0795-20121207/14480_1 /TAXON_ID=88552 /ORGANISM="Amoebophrya sp., Strain Ameob2" /LENGTH=370 /DNA_ID=CAMNT_0020701051 /DNA_START=110 /DNA_END=1224 /DNA_ORIENTATION=-
MSVKLPFSRHVTDAYAARNPFWHVGEDVTMQHEKKNDWKTDEGGAGPRGRRASRVSLRDDHGDQADGDREAVRLSRGRAAAAGGVFVRHARLGWPVARAGEAKVCGLLRGRHRWKARPWAGGKRGWKKPTQMLHALLVDKGKCELLSGVRHVRPGLRVVGDDTTSVADARNYEAKEDPGSLWQLLVYHLSKRLSELLSTPALSHAAPVAPTRANSVLPAARTAFGFTAGAGSEPYAADYGCIKGPDARGLDAGQRQGAFWSTVVAETDCPCDDEFALVANQVKRPRIDVVLSPTTLQTIRQILKLDFPLGRIPESYLDVHKFLDEKARMGELQQYFERRGGTWVFHGFDDGGGDRLDLPGAAAKYSGGFY